MNKDPKKEIEGRLRELAASFDQPAGRRESLHLAMKEGQDIYSEYTLFSRLTALFMDSPSLENKDEGVILLSAYEKGSNHEIGSWYVSIHNFIRESTLNFLEKMEDGLRKEIRGYGTDVEKKIYGV